MKKPKYSKDKSLVDTYIEEYCRSVEKLLNSISNKPNAKIRKETYEESRFIDDDEELIEH